MRPILSIIVVNYSTSSYVRRLVSSLASLTLAHEILVIDNASPNDDWRKLIDLPIRLIRSAENVGYGLGCNLGASGARGDYFCILNPDIIVPPGTMEQWVSLTQELLSRGRRIGIVAPRLVYENGVEQLSAYQFPGPVSYWPTLSVLAGVVKHLRKRCAVGCRHSAGRVATTDWVMGSAMLLPREAWEAVEGFSPRYFFYVEDTDLCWRLWHAGYEVLYAPEITLIHTQGECPAERRAEACRQLFGALEIFLSDHYPSWRRRAVEWCIVADMLLRLAVLTPLARLRKNNELSRARLTGYRDVLRTYLHVLRSSKSQA